MFFSVSPNDVLKFAGSKFLAAFVVKLYCSVEVKDSDDLYSERAKVKVYVVNSFVESWRYRLNEDSVQAATCMF